MAKRKWRRKKSKKIDLPIIDRSKLILPSLQSTQKTIPIFQSESEQITYVYQYYNTKKGRKTWEVTCVSLELKINGKWETIIRYDNDSSHNFILHRHTRISIHSEETISTTEGVKKKGDSDVYLKWCINDLKKNHFKYKKLFIDHSNKIKPNSIDIDL